MEGWIKIHRKIQQNWVWQNNKYAMAWMYCLFRANYTTTKVQIGSKLMVVERGAFITSRHNFARSTNMSEQEVKTFWKLLVEDQMIEQKATNQATKLTICNYEQYQIEQPSDQPANNQQTTTVKKKKKEKKEKRINTLFDLPGSNQLSNSPDKSESKIYQETEKCMPLARTLARIVQSKKNIDITPVKKRSWANEFRKLIYTSEMVSRKRVDDALSWYWKNAGGEYVPVIESGKSFRDKFVKLEAAMERGTQSGNKRVKHGTRQKGKYNQNPEIIEM